MTAELENAKNRQSQLIKFLADAKNRGNTLKQKISEFRSHHNQTKK